MSLNDHFKVSNFPQMVTDRKLLKIGFTGVATFGAFSCLEPEAVTGGECGIHCIFSLTDNYDSVCVHGLWSINIYIDRHILIY